MTPTAYIPVPILQKPAESGWYDLVDTQPRDYKATSGYYHEGRWFEDKETAEGTKEDFGDFDWLEDYTHWLKPIDLSRMLEEAWDASRNWNSEQWRKEGGSAPDKATYINSVLNSK